MENMDTMTDGLLHCESVSETDSVGVYDGASDNVSVCEHVYVLCIHL